MQKAYTSSRSRLIARNQPNTERTSMVDIVINAEDMRKLARIPDRIKDGAIKALVPAINRALDGGRTVIRREIRKEYEIKQKDIPMTVHRASHKGVAYRGDIEIKDEMLDLSKFKVTPRGVQHSKRRRVIRVAVRKGALKALPGAFNVQASSGYLGPFVRKGHTRLPIKKLLAIGAPIMASQPSVGAEANKVMGDTFAKRLDHEIARVMTAARSEEHTSELQ